MMTDEEIFQKWLKDRKFDDVNPEEYCCLKDTLVFQTYLLSYKVQESVYLAMDSLKQLFDGLSNALNDIEELPRPPVEIKKDIKHEKNPMRLKQLNKELNDSYKVYRKRNTIEKM